MPTALADLPLTADPPRKRWTRAEYEKLLEETLGQERLELVEGELISKMGKRRPHVNAVAALHDWLAEISGHALCCKRRLSMSPERTTLPASLNPTSSS
jgi:Uma2 family endonuclease